LQAIRGPHSKLAGLAKADAPWRFLAGVETLPAGPYPSMPTVLEAGRNP
jgi:hypothetical protein